MTTAILPRQYHSPLDAQAVRTKLLAQIQPHPGPSIFSRQEEHYPEVSLHVDQNGFKVCQRKSYVNPWEPVFHGTVLEDQDGGTILEGYFSHTGILSRLLTQYALSWMWTSIGVASAAYYASTVHGMALRGIVSIAILLALQAAYIMVIRNCEQKYKKLAEGEEAFLSEYLVTTFQAQEVPDPTPFQKAA